MKARLLTVVAAVVALIATCLFLGSSAPASTQATGFDVSGLDLHGGNLVQVGSTYYLYGEMYDCGFNWGEPNTPWCGFGYSTSPDKVTWSKPQLLFHTNEIDTYDNMDWSQVCGGTGADCYAPRMIERSGWGVNDNVWILWFDAPYDWNTNNANNSYYAMGCAGPAGPCGYDDDPLHPNPYHSVHKPDMRYCGGNADLDIVTQPGGQPVALCTNTDQTVSEEELDKWGTNGDGTGSNDVAGLTNVEGLGAYYDSPSSTWIMTYSDPNCKYCAGTQTGYATASSLLGPWTTPDNQGLGAPVGGRRDITPTSCGGQPDTVSTIDGTPYEIVDIWSGASNEGSASLHFEPLTYQPGGQPGALWQPFGVWRCE